MVDNLNPEETVSISGTVQKITYKNEANGYTVAEVKADKESITVVGLLPFLSEGDLAEFFGKFTVHPTYGQQFSATAFERKIPQNAAAILRYLSAGAI
ncbi:MAG: ATP-dependent RecD-like DNA helicase, partial [Acutalibacteraceae bacterium]|nr:ATP-dependent RecD-like DNA helicase [Acutalibacteraceae bacterium]